VRATHTIANLRRDGKALLVVTGERAAHYARLRVQTTLGIPLRPMMFHSSSRVRHLEHWDDNREFLERLGFG
jgi:hypothetical protein